MINECPHHAAAKQLAQALAELVDWIGEGEEEMRWIEVPPPLAKAVAKVNLAKATGLLR